MVLFGGFDGEFYNDLHALHFNDKVKRTNFVRPSSIDSDFSKMINNVDYSDLCLQVTENSIPRYKVHLSKLMFVQNLFERELQLLIDSKMRHDHLLADKLRSHTIGQTLCSD
jgi:hypothetical protein